MSDRVRFWIIETSFIVVFLLWLMATPKLLVWRSWAPLVLWGLSFVLAAAALIALQATSCKHLKSQFAEVIISIFIAFAFGVILVSAGHADDPGKMLQDKLVDAALVAIAVFALTTIARSSGLLEQSKSFLEHFQQELASFASRLDEEQNVLKDQKIVVAEQKMLHQQNERLQERHDHALSSGKEISTSLQGMVDQAYQAIIEARYGGLAAKALGLKRPEILFTRNNDGKRQVDEGLLESTEPGLGALQAWIDAGSRIDDEYGARQAWWRVMNVYHQEEIYDVSSNEIATNVRSYAYTLLAVISELLRGLQGKRKLVVANVSPFAPKDFYNFPNGPVGARFYHEAEFFGIYRRLFAVIAADPRTIPLRIILADPAEELNDSKAQASIGWRLDPIWKLCLDCARLRIVPWPILVGQRASRHEREFTLDPRRGSWGATFPEGRDPAKKLPSVTSTFLWAPTYAEIRNLYTDYRRDRTRDEWLLKILPYEPSAFDNDPSKKFEMFQEKAAKGKQSKIQTRIEKTASQWPAFRQIHLAMDSKDSASLWKRLDDAKRRIYGDFLARFKLAALDDQQPLDLLSAEVNRRNGGRPLGSDDGGRYAELVDTVSRSALFFIDEQTRFGTAEYTDGLLKVAENCHKIDAIGKYLQIETGLRTQSKYSSTGVELGPAEDWLHSFLVCLEASRIKSEIDKGPLPLWQLMASDLCGLSSMPDTDLISKLNNRLRLCTVSQGVPDGQSATTTIAAMEEKSIFPEFLMVGTVSIDELGGSDVVDLEKVKWSALVGASISEPYQTCRIQLLFGNDNRITEHQDWLKEVWDKGQGPTERFIAGLKSEVDLLP